MVDANRAVAAAFDVSFSGDRVDYLKQVDNAMLEMAGVRYLDVWPDIHIGSEPWKDAFDRGVSPKQFVQDTMRDFGFVQAGKVCSADEAASFNRVKAAMSGFSWGNESGWMRGVDGTLFQETDDGVAVMKPVRCRNSGRYGFGIEYREGAVLDEFKTRLVENGTPAGRFAGFDMQKALEDYDSVRNARQFRF